MRHDLINSKIIQFSDTNQIVWHENWRRHNFYAKRARNIMANIYSPSNIVAKKPENRINLWSVGILSVMLLISIQAPVPRRKKGTEEKRFNLRCEKTFFSYSNNNDNNDTASHPKKKNSSETFFCAVAPLLLKIKVLGENLTWAKSCLRHFFLLKTSVFWLLPSFSGIEGEVNLFVYHNLIFVENEVT